MDVLDAADSEVVAYLSIEPHLANQVDDPDREALWRSAHDALVQVLESL